MLLTLLDFPDFGIQCEFYDGGYRCQKKTVDTVQVTSLDEKMTYKG